MTKTRIVAALLFSSLTGMLLLFGASQAPLEEEGVDVMRFGAFVWDSPDHIWTWTISRGKILPDGTLEVGPDMVFTADIRNCFLTVDGIGKNMEQTQCAVMHEGGDTLAIFLRDFSMEYLPDAEPLEPKESEQAAWR